MSSSCSSCGSPIPDGQGSCCSMCYGDIAYGRDGYYEQWALEQLMKEVEEEDDLQFELYAKSIEDGNKD